MPVYEFKCEKCQIVQELFLEMDGEHKAFCGKCGKPMDRIFSISSVRVCKSTPWNWDPKEMNGPKDRWAHFRSKELNGEKITACPK